MSSNPWTAPLDGHGALGGLRAFVERNGLRDSVHAADAPAVSDAHSSIQLTRGLTELLERKTHVLHLTRELEQLEREVASAGCMLPHQLTLRTDAMVALCSQLQELIALKPVLLYTLRTSAATESIAVETEHQRAFIGLFEKIGAELPRHTHALHALDGMALVQADVAARQEAFARVVDDLAATIAAYTALCNDIATLRSVYAQLQSEPAVTHAGL